MLNTNLKLCIMRQHLHMMSDVLLLAQTLRKFSSDNSDVYVLFLFSGFYNYSSYN